MLKIQVAGPGCAKCEKVVTLCQEVLKEIGIEATIEKITDMNRYSQLGVYMTPGLIMNGNVKIVGKVPAKSWIEKWIKEETAIKL